MGDEHGTKVLTPRYLFEEPSAPAGTFSLRRGGACRRGECRRLRGGFSMVTLRSRSMWIVRLALRRPYTFVVLALVILILGPLVILRTPTDVFPEINIPVVSIVWNYTGLSSEDMGNRITSVTERALTTLVDDIEHIESQSLNGIAVVKVFFQPHANIEKAIAQVTEISQTHLRQFPPGA